MMPLYAARVADMQPGDFVEVKCACGHEQLIAPLAMTQSLKLAPDDRILSLERRLRCRECDARGSAVVGIRWGQ
jgi:hypothetical protein